MMNATVRRALLGREPVFAVAHRRPGGAQTWYGVHSPGRTSLLLFTDAAHARELAEGLAGYHDAHGAYPPRDWVGHRDQVLFAADSRALGAWDDLTVEELRLDLFVRRQRGSGVAYSIVFDVDEDGVFLSKDLVLDDLRNAPAWLDRLAGRTACPPGELRDFPLPMLPRLLPPPQRPRQQPELPCDCEPADD